MGGDQGGSIRMVSPLLVQVRADHVQPASKQGLVGMKATFGLVPYTGIVSLEASLDHTGPMTRDVTLNAAMLQAIAGYDGIDDRAMPGCPSPENVPDYVAAVTQGVQGLKVGILTEGFGQPTGDSRVDVLVRKAINSLKALGMEAEEVSIPMHKVAPNLWAVSVCERIKLMR
jgi:amidase